MDVCTECTVCVAECAGVPECVLSALFMHCLWIQCTACADTVYTNSVYTQCTHTYYRLKGTFMVAVMHTELNTTVCAH